MQLKLKPFEPIKAKTKQFKINKGVSMEKFNKPQRNRFSSKKF